MKESALRIGIGFSIILPFFLLAWFGYPTIPQMVMGFITGIKVWEIANYIVEKWIGYRS